MWNIFLTRTGRVQLGDLGIAKQLTATMDVAKTTIGTPMYMSPEILQVPPPPAPRRVRLQKL